MVDRSITHNSPAALRVKGVSAFTSLGVSTIWLWSAQGKFPKPFRVGRATLWLREDIQKWLDAQAA